MNNRKIINIGLYLFSLLVLIIFVFTISSKYKKFFFPRENSNIVINKEKIEKNIEKLQSELNYSPENVKIMVELGIYYFLKGPDFYDKSINLLYKAWQSGSTDIRTFYYLGVMYEFLNLYNLAINEYKKFLINIPNDIEVNLRLGNLYYKTGKLDDAINVFTYVLKKDKNNIIALTNLGFIYFSREEFNDAQEYFLKAKNICNKKNLIEPKNLNFYLGRIYFNNKNFETAKKYFEQEYKNYPDNLENNLMLAKTYYELKDLKATLALVQQIQKDYPKHKDLLELQKKIKKNLS
ncbi:MAG: tetratricopeptide repeat protein [Endomicrobiia bacterium]